MTEIVIGLIAAVSAVIGSFLANNKNVAVLQERIKDIKGDISVLSNRVDKHNNLVERMAVVEQSTKSAHHRIDTIEKRGDKE